MLILSCVGLYLLFRLCRGRGQPTPARMLPIILDEAEYDPQWDGAGRDWARASDMVRRDRCKYSRSRHVLPPGRSLIKRN
jgi:hypothetical protein